MMEYGIGECTEDHHKNAPRIFTHMDDTTIVERPFPVKSGQCKDPASRKIAPITLWRGPARQKVVSEDFHSGKEVSVTKTPGDACDVAVCVPEEARQGHDFQQLRRVTIPRDRHRIGRSTHMSPCRFW